MARDLVARMSELLQALDADADAWPSNEERWNHLYKRTRRLQSLRRQVERLTDELELELVSAGRGTTEPSEGDRWVDLEELEREVDDLRRQRGDEDDD
jgi:hypothetical protein